MTTCFCNKDNPSMDRRGSCSELGAKANLGAAVHAAVLWPFSFERFDCLGRATRHPQPCHGPQCHYLEVHGTH